MRFKKPLADLRATYKRAMKISIIISLAILIFAFKFFPHLEDKGMALEGPQELFTVEDIQQTKQENRPPHLQNHQFQLKPHLTMYWRILK